MPVSRASYLNALDGNGPLTLQLLAVAILLFLLAVLEAGTIVRLQHTVLPTKVTLAEAAVADDALCLVFALLEVAADALGTAAADRECHVDGALPGDVVRRELLGGGGEVFPGEDQAEVRFGHVRAERQERAEIAHRCRLGNGDGKGWANVSRSVLSPDRGLEIMGEWECDVVLTVASHVLDEDLHGCFGLRGGSAGGQRGDGGDGGDAVGSHGCGGGEVVASSVWLLSSVFRRWIPRWWHVWCG